MDIMAQLKDKVEEIVEKIKADENIAADFQRDPISTVEKLIGIDLPNDQLQSVVDTVKAKIDLDKISDVLGGLGSLFGKK